MTNNKNILLTTDLHLTEKGEDSYRFDLFPWVLKHYPNLRGLIILGDLTDRKDFHAGWFVNKIVDSIRMIAKHYPVWILKGNHDYDTDDKCPFFGFTGKYHNITYISVPKILQIQPGSSTLFLPHTRKPGEDWGILSKPEMGLVNTIFMHQTFRGAVAESGKILGGISPHRFRRYKCPIFSGDIHVPQQLGSITYVGCPYHIRYGDKFEPRMLLLNRRFEIQDVQFPAPRKLMLDLKHGDELNKMRRKLQSGDRVKVRIHLPRSKFGSWPRHRDRVRKTAKEIGIQLHSIILKEYHDTDEKNDKRTKNMTKIRTHAETYDAFCSKYDIESDITQVGSVFLEE